MITVQYDDFDLGVEYEKLRKSSQSAGAIVTFTGLVRQVYEKQLSDEIVQSLYLEHYPGMTERALENIESQASSRWDLLGANIIHRVGDLKANEQIVFVGVASPHRKDAFLAAQFIMDFLKNEAPFWKKQRTLKCNKWVESRQSDLDATERWR